MVAEVARDLDLTPVRSDRRSEGALRAPAVVSDPGVQRGVVHTESFGPLFDGHRAAVVRDFHNEASIVGLLAAGRPFHVAGLVVPIIVFAVKRMLQRWARPKVGKKVLKLLPALTDRNPPTAVDGPPTGSRVPASVEHVLPNLVFVARRHAMRSWRAYDFRPVATAACRASFAQLLRLDGGVPTAVAFAGPCRFSMAARPLVWSRRYDNQSAISFARNIHPLHHAVLEGGI